MGALTLGQNSISLRLRTQLSRTSAAYSQNLQRLSSGARINRASDDAAGLAIATRLGAHTRIYGQAIRNLNDGISALNVAEGALGQMHIIGTRLREVAEQSANGVLTSAQREALDEEASALISEYNRITQSTSFNNRQLLDGTLSSLAVQLGFSSVSFAVGSNIANEVGNGEFADVVTSGSGVREDSIAVGDLNGDGLDDNVSIQVSALNTTTVYIQLSNGDGTFTQSTRTLTSMNGAQIELGDLNNDGKLDIVVYGYWDKITSYPIRSAYMMGVGDGTFGVAGASGLTSEMVAPTLGAITLADMNGDGYLDLVDSFYDNALGQAYIGIRLGNGTGAFTLGTTYSVSDTVDAIEAVDLNGDNHLDLVYANGNGSQMLNNGSGGLLGETVLVAGSTFGMDVGDLNGDGILDVVFGGSAGVSSYLSSGTGSNPLSLYATSAGVANAVYLYDVDEDGNLDVITGTTTRLGNGDGSFGTTVNHKAAYGTWAIADINNDGVADLVGVDSGVGAMLGLTDTLTTLSPASIATQEEALTALDTFSTLLDNLERELGSVGSHQSRLRFALGNLFVTRDGYGVAASRIRDADLAQEAALMVRNQVLQDSEQALLAQANQSSELVLSLLNEVASLPKTLGLKV